MLSTLLDKIQDLFQERPDKEVSDDKHFTEHLTETSPLIENGAPRDDKSPLILTIGTFSTFSVTESSGSAPSPVMESGYEDAGKSRRYGRPNEYGTETKERKERKQSSLSKICILASCRSLALTYEHPEALTSPVAIKNAAPPSAFSTTGPAELKKRSSSLRQALNEEVVLDWKANVDSIRKPCLERGYASVKYNEKARFEEAFEVVRFDCVGCKRFSRRFAVVVYVAEGKGQVSEKGVSFVVRILSEANDQATAVI